jgi:hypothetical protein
MIKEEKDTVSSKNYNRKMSKKKKKGISQRASQAFAGDPTWEELKGTPLGDAILNPRKRGDFDKTNREWTELEQIATAAGESIKMNERISRRQLRRLIREEASAGLPGEESYEKFKLLRDWLGSKAANPVQRGCGEILDVLGKVSRGTGSYEDIIKKTQIIMKSPAYNKKK